MLIEIQFDEIQKGQKSRSKQKLPYYGKHIKEFNIVAEEKGLMPPVMAKKKSFVDKVVNSLTKLCSSGSTEEFKMRGLHRAESHESDDDEEEEVVNVNGIKLH